MDSNHISKESNLNKLQCTSDLISWNNEKIKKIDCLLKCAAEAYFGEIYTLAINYYKQSLELMNQVEDNDVNEQKYIVKYIICLAYLQSSKLEDLTEAMFILQTLEKNYFDKIPAIYLALGFLHYKLYNFELAQDAIKKGIAVINSDKNFEPLYIPGTNFTIEETVKENYRTLLLDLKEKCLSWHKPDAICFISDCQNVIQPNIKPKREIYFRDPAFDGMIVVTCSNITNSCVTKYHISCWKFQKEQLFPCSNISDAQAIGLPCFTPNCELNNSRCTIALIEIIDLDGNVKSSIGANPKTDPYLNSNFNPTGAIRKQTVINSSTNNLETKEPQAIEGETQSPHDFADMKVSYHRSAVIEALNEIQRVTCLLGENNQRSNMQNSLKELSEDCPNSIFHDNEIEKIRSFILSYFYSYVENNGLTRHQDILDEWQKCKTLIDLDNEDKFLESHKDIIDFLLQSEKFVSIGGYIDLSKSSNEIIKNKVCIESGFDRVEECPDETELAVDEFLNSWISNKDIIDDGKKKNDKEIQFVDTTENRATVSEEECFDEKRKISTAVDKFLSFTNEENLQQLKTIDCIENKIPSTNKHIEYQHSMNSYKIGNDDLNNKPLEDLERFLSQNNTESKSNESGSSTMIKMENCNSPMESNQIIITLKHENAVLLQQLKESQAKLLEYSNFLTSSLKNEHNYSDTMKDMYEKDEIIMHLRHQNKEMEQLFKDKLNGKDRIIKKYETKNIEMKEEMSQIKKAITEKEEIMMKLLSEEDEERRNFKMKLFQEQYYGFQRTLESYKIQFIIAIDTIAMINRISKRFTSRTFTNADEWANSLRRLDIIENEMKIKMETRTMDSMARDEENCLKLFNTLPPLPMNLPQIVNYAFSQFIDCMCSMNINNLVQNQARSGLIPFMPVQYTQPYIPPPRYYPPQYNPNMIFKSDLTPSWPQQTGNTMVIESENVVDVNSNKNSNISANTTSSVKKDGASQKVSKSNSVVSLNLKEEIDEVLHQDNEIISRSTKSDNNLDDDDLNINKSVSSIFGSVNSVASSADNSDKPKDERKKRWKSMESLLELLENKFQNVPNFDLVESIEEVRKNHNNSLSGLSICKILTEITPYIERRQVKRIKDAYKINDNVSKKEKNQKTSGMKDTNKLNNDADKKKKIQVPSEKKRPIQTKEDKVPTNSVSSVPSLKIMDSVIKEEAEMQVVKSPSCKTWKTVEDKRGEWIKTEKETICIICLSELNYKNMKSIYTLKCRHTFHTKCLKTWFEKNQSCPDCRAFSVLDEEYPPLP